MVKYDQLMKVMDCEVATLQLLSQQQETPNVCRYHGMLEDDERLVLVFDYCDGGQIMTPDGVSYSFTGAMSETQIKSYFGHIVRGL